MEIMAALGCPRIAAPSAGIGPTDQLDMFKSANDLPSYSILGKETGVMP